MWNKKSTRAFLTPTIGRELVLKGVVLKAIGRLKEKSVLDLGCGSGYWTRIFQSHGARCIGIDRSPEQIKFAESFNTRGVKYIVSDAATFNSKSKFDIIFIDHIISETSTPGKAVQILKTARRLLKKSGFIILNEMHPAVAHFPLRKLKTRKDYFYFRSGAPFIFRIKQLNGKYITIRDYHWTLEDFYTFIRKAELSIETIVEPRPLKLKGLNKHLRERYKYPSHLIIRAVPK